jgi:hypothetical protein
VYADLVYFHLEKVPNDSMKYSRPFFMMSLSSNRCFIVTSEMWFSIKATMKIVCHYPGILICSNHL